MAAIALVQNSPPIPPDFHSCDFYYGQDIRIVDCVSSWNNMLSGSQPVRYRVGQPTGLNVPQLPYISGDRSCYIAVEAAGPANVEYLDIIPNVLRSRAGWVIEQCVRGLESGVTGSGGFVTLGMGELVSYVFNPAADFINPTSYPDDTAFITVTVSTNDDKWPQPGNLNPAVPLKIGDYHLSQVLNSNTDPTSANIYGRIASILRESSIRMTKGGNRPWWGFTSAVSDKMTYECDANLGSPSEVDCTHIEWSELLPDSDSLQVEPGVVTFLHSSTSSSSSSSSSTPLPLSPLSQTTKPSALPLLDTCYVSISTINTTPLTLLWSQIRTALSTLLTICVQNPLLSPQGGRAYYGPQPPLQLSGRWRKRDKKHKHKRQDDDASSLTGLNALPPGANITVFSQAEPWVDAAVEMKSCTWEAVMRGVAVSTCPA